MGDSRHLLHAVRLVVLLSMVASLFVFTQESSAAFGGVQLVWTSPADYGGARVFGYDLRINAVTINGIDTLSWWNGATKIDMKGKTPRTPGAPDSILLGGLVPGIRYYAILRSVGAGGNWSAFSNMALFTPGTITAVGGGDDAPALVVGNPRPSPTSGRAEATLSLPTAMTVEAAVFDAQGRLARRLESGVLGPGLHPLRWDGTLDRGGQAASGVYWIRVLAGRTERRVKLVVVR
jgi:flagellar hook capping protein FlgD